MDQKLLQKLYQTYYRELYLYVYSLCRDKLLSEDILQDTFVKAILALPDGHTNMRAWLYTVARNLTFNALKREGNLSEILSRSKPPASDFEPISLIIQQEKYQSLYQALMKLDTRKREILIMQYFGGLKQKEIAAVLHITPENVRVLAGRARREIKSYMEEDGYDLP